MKDIMGLMKQAQAMQSRMQELQAQLDQVEVEGQAGSGGVRVVLTAKGAMRGVTAHEDARRKGEALVQERMQAITAGLPLPPGMKLPF
jgi:DNA-binding protein YbaB